MQRQFKLEVSPSGVRIYTDVEAGNKRIELMNDFKSGKITQEEMRKKAKKHKMLFYEKDLPSGYELI